MGRNLKKQMSFANDVGADYVVIVGEREIKQNRFVVKDMRTGEQKLLSVEEIVSLLK
jgi:histidyl-tRNA synthetase